jgi:hypothetical protein
VYKDSENIKGFIFRANFRNRLKRGIGSIVRLRNKESIGRELRKRYRI